MKNRYLMHVLLLSVMLGGSFAVHGAGVVLPDAADDPALQEALENASNTQDQTQDQATDTTSQQTPVTTSTRTTTPSPRPVSRTRTDKLATQRKVKIFEKDGKKYYKNSNGHDIFVGYTTGRLDAQQFKVKRSAAIRFRGARRSGKRSAMVHRTQNQRSTSLSTMTTPRRRSMRSLIRNDDQIKTHLRAQKKREEYRQKRARWAREAEETMPTVKQSRIQRKNRCTRLDPITRRCVIE